MTIASNSSASKPADAASALGQHAASLSSGKPGVLHGSLTYVLQDDDGQTADVHSVSAGLDYPGVGPEHAYWKDTGRVEYVSITDAEALDAFQLLARSRAFSRHWNPPTRLRKSRNSRRS